MHGLRFVRFEQDWSLFESRVIDEQAKSFRSNLSLTNVRMPVYSCAQPLFAVVAMDGFQPVEANNFPKRLERRFISFRSSDIVSSDKNVASVQTNAEPFVSLQCSQKPRKLFEIRIERGPLSCCRLHQEHDLFGSFREQAFRRLSNNFQ